MTQADGATRRSSFYLAMRVLPQDKREAMYDVYAFCRAVDDIADDNMRARDERSRALEDWRRTIDAIYAGAPPDDLASLAKAIRVYGMKREDFMAIIDGMEMDVLADIRAPDRATFDLYCDRVACAVGRLSTRVFGLEQKAGESLADHLGRALQVTNVLRDLDEDADFGRLYMPKDALAKAGITSDNPAEVLADPRLDVAARALIAEARSRFRAARDVMKKCPNGLVRAPRLMAAVYGAILDRLEKRGFAPPRASARPSTPVLLLAALRGFF
jgi:presqualene diphosphate synthase